jgi:DNA-binding CsgD family transcriptional regulator
VLMELAEGAPVVDGGLGLLEREPFIDQLDEWLGDASGGHGRLVLLAGEAGIGKTALVRSFCERRETRPRVLWGACDGLRTPRPLGPFVDIAAETGGALRKVVENGRKPAGCFAALTEELEAAPTIVVLEDLHWADEATLDVLVMLGRRAASVGGLTIVTYRDDGLGANDPLRAAMGDLRGESGVRRLSLPPLSLEAVSRLVPADAIDAGALYERTAGNPFFVTEVLAAGDADMPATVRDAVLARAAQLNEAARRVLDAVAVVPQPLEVQLLERLLGAELDDLDECLASGMLRAEGAAVAFRHELARLAVEEAISPHRRVALNRGVLAALRSTPEGAPDAARMAHHAEAAGDGPAVLEFAPAAAARAASVGAHREAAAQYARALRFADGLDPADRAALLEGRSEECGMAAMSDEAIADLRAALECYRTLGDRRKQADVLCSLARRLYCPGHTSDSDGAVRAARDVLEGLPPCRELARAYAVTAAGCMNAEDADGTYAWGPRAIELAERLDERDILAYALNDLGTMEFLTQGPGGRERLERSLDLSLEEGFEEHAARAFIHLAWAATRVRAHDLAAGYIRDGIEYCTERDLVLYLPYFFTRRASIELDRGRWDEAAEAAATVARNPRSAPDARAPALAVLGLVRARRGDPDQWSPLDEARDLAASDAELQRRAPVASARAEALWLEGRNEEVDSATKEAFELSLARNAPWLVGELACWRRRAGLRDMVPDGVAAEPYALSLAGEWTRAAARWREMGCPYEAALALGDSDDEHALREALDELHALGARPAAAIVARRLRERGARGLPRGPRAPTRENPAGLTARELEVLELLTEGLRDAQIAERLVVSKRTVGHHVSAILRKLHVRTRGEASAEAARLGVAQDRQRITGT